MGTFGIPDDEFGLQRKEAEDTSKYGYTEGEICNRLRCEGVLIEGEKDGDGCSCHVNPPCSYCMQNVAYCPTCGWDAKEEDQP